MRLFYFLRYRFFLLAGIFPYLLGQAIAFNTKRFIDIQIFWIGLAGIFLVLTGVELFNEYFDAKEGGDRIFLEEKPAIPDWFFPLGLFAFILALGVGLYLTWRSGWLVLLFSFLGFLAAYFYVGPPFKWAYRGLGELVISLSYGPFMVYGSYYLQARRIDLEPLFGSLVCGLSIFGLALVNEIPDYYQDRLVGKNNLVVRFGRPGAVRLTSLTYLSLFILLMSGLAFQKIPLLSAFIFLAVPQVLKSLKNVETNYDKPPEFLGVINTKVILYLVINFFLTAGYLKS